MRRPLAYRGLTFKLILTLTLLTALILLSGSYLSYRYLARDVLDVARMEAENKAHIVFARVEDGMLKKPSADVIERLLKEVEDADGYRGKNSLTVPLTVPCLSFEGVFSFLTGRQLRYKEHGCRRVRQSYAPSFRTASLPSYSASRK